jgi:hypothetical protein
MKRVLLMVWTPPQVGGNFVSGRVWGMRVLVGRLPGARLTGSAVSRCAFGCQSSRRSSPPAKGMPLSRSMNHKIWFADNSKAEFSPSTI